jgi:hypothetical protein
MEMCVRAGWKILCMAANIGIQCPILHAEYDRVYFIGFSDDTHGKPPAVAPPPSLLLP